MDIIYRFNPYEPVECTTFKSAEEALSHLREGHGRYHEIIDGLRDRVYGAPSENIVIPTSLTSRGVSMVPGISLAQRPFAVVVSCSDARVPLEEIFQVSANSVFVVRVAGQAMGTEVLGSILYALLNFEDSIRLIIVLGHTECGAVTAAVQSLSKTQSAPSTIPPSIGSIVNRIQPSVKICGCTPGQNVGTPHSQEALVEASCFVHAAKVAMELRSELGLAEQSLPQVVYGVYDLRTSQIRSRPAPHTGSSRNDFLAEAPHSDAALNALALDVVRDANAAFDAPEAEPEQSCTTVGAAVQ
jgi:carbonic anhydrase